MATHVLAVNIPEEGQYTWCAAIDAAKLSADHVAVLCGELASSPSERKKAGIPGCSVEWGTIITQEDSKDVEDGDDDKTFLDEKWTKVNPSELLEFTRDHHCIVVVVLDWE